MRKVFDVEYLIPHQVALSYLESAVKPPQGEAHVRPPFATVVRVTPAPIIAWPARL